MSNHEAPSVLIFDNLMMHESDWNLCYFFYFNGRIFFVFNLRYYVFNLDIFTGYNQFLNNILIDRFEFITEIVKIGLQFK